MKSTELSTALEICARRRYRAMVRAEAPWRAGPTRKERFEAFRKCWQDSVYDAAVELDLWTPVPMDFVADLMRGVPTGLIEEKLGYGPTDRSDSDRAA